MILSKLGITSSKLSPFQTYLLSNLKIKKISQEFDFYKVLFYREECSKESIVYLQYPKGNVYWFVDFEKYIKANFLGAEASYVDEWNNLLLKLKIQIRQELTELKDKLTFCLTRKNVVKYQCLYKLRDYQSYDLIQFLTKYDYWNNRGLILSEPRTGKTRIALAACAERLKPEDVALVICPKSAEVGWMKEIEEFNNFSTPIFETNMITNISKIKSLELNSELINIRLISYDLFKRLTIPQIRQLTSKSKHIILLGDEIHRLRNFKTQQSKAIFDFKDFCIKDKVNLGIIGITGTPAVKESSDIFGLFSLINESKIQFQPYYTNFDCFKEYFYYCEDTSFGKKAKALRREHELNYLIQTCSVQTKQHELDMFKNYIKKYLKIDLQMDAQQQKIYDSVYENMEYDEDIDCQNKLVQLVRLQQICIDPFGLVASYESLSPKLQWCLAFTKASKYKFIIACKKTKPLEHLMKIFDTEKIEYSCILGKLSFAQRLSNLEAFSTNPSVKVMFLQLDTGREALTLPAAHAIIFLDRDFAQGFNEQAEARMTPVNGLACKKLVIDLVMSNSKEEQIYNTLVVKKKSIDAINMVFKSRKVNS